MIRWRRALTVLILLAVPAHVAARPASPPRGRLVVVVKDPSGAVIVGAAVTATGTDGTAHQAKTDTHGTATLDGLAPGRYQVQAAAAGFETRTLDRVRIGSGRTRREMTLKIAAVAEHVNVGRNAREAASDARGGFESVLSPDQIAQLPDDEDELRQELENMAGPGAVLRVDGFTGGRLPPKNEIEEIRFHRDFFAADKHAGSFVTVDIITKPGFGTWSGGLGGGLRTTGLDARNAFSPTRGSGRFDRYGFNASGPLWKGHTSASLALGGISSYQSQTVLAALPSGTFAAPIQQPADNVDVDAILHQALSKTHALRLEYQRNNTNDQNLGVGGFDLASRAYTQATNEQLLRLSDVGPFGQHLFNELHVQFDDQRVTTTPASQAPAVLVLNAFSSGGAQLEGTTRTRDWTIRDDLDISFGRNAFRTGALIQTDSERNAEAQNATGTFTFSSLAAYLAGRPTTFTERTGNPAVSFGQLQGGVYLQDDIRVSQSLMVSAGLRTEWQSHIGGVHLAPRGGITWAPTRDGRTTIRAGGGIFYDWYTADTYAQTLQVNGTRQTNLVIQNPGYPDPFAGGLAALVVPNGVIRQAANLQEPEIREGLIGVEHRFADGVNLNVIYSHRAGSHLLHSVDVNAPRPDGSRPDPALGNIYQIESNATSTRDALILGAMYGNPKRHLMLGFNYILSRATNEADSALSLPANSYAPISAELGPSATDARHRFFSMVQVPLPENLRLGVSLYGHSAYPYTITTGFDNNGDGVVNDRPAGVGRNSARGAANVTVDARLSWTVGIGRTPAGPHGPTIVRVHAGGNALAALPANAAGHRYAVEFYVQAYNLFNRFNPTTFSGVETSPFFGQATAAGPARRIEFGTRIIF